MKTILQDYDRVCPSIDDLQVIRVKCSNLEYEGNNASAQYHNHAFRLTLPTLTKDAIKDSVRRCSCRKKGQYCEPNNCISRPIMVVETNNHPMPSVIAPGALNKDTLDYYAKTCLFVANPILNPEHFFGAQTDSFYTVNFPILRKKAKIETVYKDLAFKIETFVNTLLINQRQDGQPFQLQILLEMCALYQYGVSLMTARTLIAGARELLIEKNIDIEITVAIVPSGLDQEIVKCTNDRHSSYSPICRTCLRQLTPNMDAVKAVKTGQCQYADCESLSKKPKSKTLKRGIDDSRVGSNNSKKQPEIDPSASISSDEYPPPVPSLPQRTRPREAEEASWFEEPSRSLVEKPSTKPSTASDSYAYAANLPPHRPTAVSKRHASRKEKDPPTLVDITTGSSAFSIQNDSAANSLCPPYLLSSAASTNSDTLAEKSTLDNNPQQAQQIAALNAKIKELDSLQPNYSIMYSDMYNTLTKRIEALEEFRSSMDSFRTQCNSAGILSTPRPAHISQNQKKKLEGLNEAVKDHLNKVEVSTQETAEDLQQCKEDIRKLKITSERRESTLSAASVSTVQAELTDFKSEMRTALKLLSQKSLCSACGLNLTKLTTRSSSEISLLGSTSSVKGSEITDFNDPQTQVLEQNDQPMNSPTPLANEGHQPVSEGIFTVTDDSTSHPLPTMVLSPQYLALESDKSPSQSKPARSQSK